MKLQNSSGKSEVIDFGGNVVKFINGVAEVEDSVGKFILDAGYADVYELGKLKSNVEVQPEIDLNPEILRLSRENARLESIIGSLNEEIAKLQDQVKIWKDEVIKLTSGSSESSLKEAEEALKETDLEERIRSMKKEELSLYCKELGLPHEGKKDELMKSLLKELKK